MLPAVTWKGQSVMAGAAQTRRLGLCVVGGAWWAIRLLRKAQAWEGWRGLAELGSAGRAPARAWRAGGAP